LYIVQIARKLGLYVSKVASYEKDCHVTPVDVHVGSMLYSEHVLI